eukprot:CAMPEP_0202712666 /NCGR_PEP_ID=MMETSP1385-20130828/43701_1 /ASSEMBLY_ACC=CAM_ASM_000861 /TAXON_ID=933848 /ORGANISM="Elphidium margaritaceum" /LENGTH=299 /DNA_ID=CAMNT_0049372765 /DNA_START=62 /DNA_END=961 /DNA_ORIENTATION=-
MNVPSFRRLMVSQPLHHHTPAHHHIHRFLSYPRPRAIPQISDRGQAIVYRITKNTANKTPSFSTYASWPITEVVDVIDGEHEHMNHQAESRSLSAPYHSVRVSSPVRQAMRSPATHHHPYFESAASANLKRPSHNNSHLQSQTVHTTRSRPKTDRDRIAHWKQKQVKHEYTTSTATHTTTLTTISTSRWMHDDETAAMNGGRATSTKPSMMSSAPITLAKATGSLDAYLDEQTAAADTSSEEMQCAPLDGMNEQDTADHNIEMRNDLKWRRRKMKLHIRKKRRDRLRYKKKAMQQRTNK